MPDTMQAVVNHGPRNYRLEELHRPQAGPGQALVQVEAVGICASDLKCYNGAAKFGGMTSAQPGPRPRSSPDTSSSGGWSSSTRLRPSAGRSKSAIG